MRALIYICLIVSGHFLFASVEERLVEVNEAQIFCKIIGQGDPIVVVHGGPAMMHNYLFDLAKLSETHQVIFYDQRGCGKSSCEINEDTIRFDLFVDDLERLRKALNLEKITLLAHSWGGLLSMKYAITYPESIDRLILLNSLPASFEDCYLTVTESMKQLDPYQEELQSIERSKEFLSDDPDTVQKYFKLRSRVNFYDPKKADLLNVSLTLKDFKSFLKIGELLTYNMIMDPFDWYEDLKNWNFPVLIVHSDFDFIPLTDAQKVHESISNSQYVVIKECGHCPFIEKPEELLDHLFNFLLKRN